MTELEKILNEKVTENGDSSYKSTGNKYLDILFMTEYFKKHLNEIPTIGKEEYDKWFAMFIRDPRFGIGQRDIGRVLMKDSELAPTEIVKAGRFDDLIMIPTVTNLNYLMSELRNGNDLARKWMPRLTSKNSKLAKAFCKQFEMSEKDYRELIKCETTVEYKLAYCEKDINKTTLNDLFEQYTYTHPLVDTINFEHVPSLAMIKYYNLFSTREDLKDRFAEYLESVKKGDKKLNVSTTTVYDIYRNRNEIDTDLFFDKLEKISINCIPVLDTSGSMWDSNDSMGKAMSIAHYLSKCSTFCPNQVVSFSSNPKLITLGNNPNKITQFGKNNESEYINELNSMYTGDCSNTDLGKVMELFKDLNETPEYLVILSDMEFDCGSKIRKDELMNLWKDKGYSTKIVWWNFNSRNTTVPEMDDSGNIYLSGYNPMLLQFLSANFDGKLFLDNLLREYRNKIVDNN